MSNKLYDGDKAKKKKYDIDYGLICFISQVIVVVFAIVSLVFVIGVDKKVDKLLNTPNTEVFSEPIDIDMSNTETTNPEVSGLEKGEAYAGFFAEDLEKLDYTLNEVVNIADYMNSDFDGHVYTMETGTYMEVELPTDISFEEYALNVTDTSGFSALKERCTETSDENGTIYTLTEGEEDYFFIRGLEDEVPSYDGATTMPCNVVYFCINDYDKCKDLGIALGDVTIDSTIEEVVGLFGTPTYVDVYESHEEAPYLMLYYSKLNEETYTIDEMSLIFEINENAENGYYLSEVTVSVFE